MKAQTVREAIRRCSGKVSVNGAEIFYERLGSGPSVVLLMPGIFGSTTTDFGPQLKGLSRDKFTLVAWDPRGFGNSIPPRRDFPIDYLKRDASDAALLMEKLGFLQYSLVGWSDGGNTALLLAAMHPKKIKKLVVWGCTSYVTKEDCDDWEKIRDVSKWSEKMRGPLATHYGADELQKSWSECLDTTAEILAKHGGEFCSKELRFIEAPTLILHGMKDVIASHQHAEYIHQNIRGSILERWEEGKHNLHLRYPDKFNARVDLFLSE